jgi:hypothetical protein
MARFEDPKELATYDKVLAFARWTIEAARNDGYPGDVDGGSLQDSMESIGILVPVKVTEPCDPDNCVCAENDGLPGECYRLDPDVKALLFPAPPSEGDASRG